jgi:type IV secretory pathway TraG/TraD family ATPase VirD4
MLDNAGVIQCFGAANLRAARGFCDLVGGLSAEEVLSLGRDELIALVEGGLPERLRCARYFREPEFKDQYDAPNLRSHRIAEGFWTARG